MFCTHRNTAAFSDSRKTSHLPQPTGIPAGLGAVLGLGVAVAAEVLVNWRKVSYASEKGCTPKGRKNGILGIVIRTA